MIAFQMRIVNKGTYKGGALMTATNPYTGYGYYRWEGKGTPWGKTFIHKSEDDEEEKEDTSTDDWQATNVSWRRCQEAQYWCNGYGR